MGICEPDGVPVDVRVVLVESNSPGSGCGILALLGTPLAVEDVEVIVHTETAFFRYFLSRRVVPLVIPTS